MSNRRQRKLLWIAIGCVAIIVILAGIALWIHAVRTRDKLVMQLNEMGRILSLFVDDNGRMPRNEEELFLKGYLERSAGRTPQVGEAVHGRHAAGISYSVDTMDFPDMDRIRVAYGDVGDSEHLISVASRFESPHRAAADMSRIVRWRLANCGVLPSEPTSRKDLPAP